MAGNKVYRGFVNGTHRYRLRVWDGTKQVSQEFRAAGGKRVADHAADDELSKMVRRIARNPGSAHDRTLADLWDDYEEHVVATNRYSPTTLRDHRATMKAKIIPELGHIKLRELTSYRLDAFYALESSNVSARTVLKYHRLLSTVFRQAERWGWIETPPTHNATPPQVTRTEVTAPGVDIILLLLEECKNDNLVALMVLLAAALGARRGELMGLRWEDIDYSAGTVAIRRSIYEPPGGGVAVKPTKTDRPRTITLDTRSLDTLRRLSVGRSGFVFSDDGESPWRPQRASKAYRALRKKVPSAAGVRFHDLRHWHATQLIAQGFDVKTVSTRLGHANPTTTLNIYTAALGAPDRAAAKAIGELLK